MSESELGKRLKAIRQKAVDEGMELLSQEEIDCLLHECDHCEEIQRLRDEVERWKETAIKAARRQDEVTTNRYAEQLSQAQSSIKELEEGVGKCSVCGQSSAICMDAEYKGTYFLCAECVEERAGPNNEMIKFLSKRVEELEDALDYIEDILGEGLTSQNKIQVIHDAMHEIGRVLNK